MSNAVDPTTGLATRNSLGKWVDEMQVVLKDVTRLLEETDRQRGITETAQRESSELRDETAKLRVEIGSLRADLEQYRGIANSAQHERDELRESVAALQTENDRLRGEQTEAGETAAKLLGEMKELVNQVAHKFQGSSRTSPFAREPRSPNT
jgi:uncharacterized coiled-coil DUF342 family protein